MLRLGFSITLNYEITQPGCDFIFNIHAAQTAHQTVVRESLTISQPLQPAMYTDAVTHNRYLRLHAPEAGPLTVHYDAVVDLDHHVAQPMEVAEVSVADLPGAVLPYIYPSRYCESDRLHRLAVKEFGHLPQGFTRVQAISNWVTQRVMFRSNTSNGNTTALDTLVDETGVCRDFAHLMIALCRGVNIPARFATGIDYGADPALGPTDFHAYVEVFVGQRWYLFDPSGTAIPMGFVRFATGRDAADAAFATIFGGVQGTAPVMKIEALPNAQGVLVLPQHVPQALSTDSPLS
ncbi:transglutaminase-like domain-containing protein [Rhodoferax saidenbachensis]|uniref:Transglutaminase n=1 Tax=Rhodoferax saidenbachensis TaxID=1484693 RepID=A0A1P8KAG1_9BURK|nr:transglutaminase family protein [Rhodoferax saidenbachensis]APW42981.1 transglutaminase [Rhodoferax saidenbachensis]